MTNDSFKVKGDVLIDDIDKHGNVIRQTHYENAFLNNGVNRILATLAGNAHMAYCFIGIGDKQTTDNPQETKITNERYRKNITNASIITPFNNANGRNYLEITAYFDAQEANFLDSNGNVVSWGEIGLYAGIKDQFGTFSNITLFNKALINEEKTDAVAKNITWIISIL